MAKYRVTTEDGVYEVTTEDGPEAAPVKPSAATAPVPGRDRDPQTGLELPGMPAVPGAPSRPLASSRRSNALGGRPLGAPSGANLPAPVEYTPAQPAPPTGSGMFVSGGQRAMKGAKRFLAEEGGPLSKEPGTPIGEKLGGATDMVLGGMEAAAPLQLSRALPTALETGAGMLLRSGAGAALRNRLPTALASTADAIAETAPTFRQAVVPLLKPAAKAVVGGAVGGGLGQATGSYFDLSPGTTEALTASGGMAGAVAPAPRTEALGHAHRIKNAQVPTIDSVLERGASEILHDSPDLGNGQFLLTRPGETTVAILDRYKGTLKRIWNESDQALQPLYAQGVTTPVPQVQQKVMEALGTDPATMKKSWSGVSEALRAEVEGMQGKEYSLKDLLTLIKEGHTKLAAFHRMGLTQQREAGLKGDDIAVMQARVDGYKDALYSKVAQVSAPLAAFVKDRMASYGAVAQMRNNIEPQLAEAYAEVPKGMLGRVVQGTIGAAKGLSGSIGWAMPHVEHAVSPDKTIATNILKGFAQFAKGGDLAPRAIAPLALQYTQDKIPMALPPSRQIAAPTGPIGVSGVTVPDTTGQIQGLAQGGWSHKGNGPLRLAAPQPGVPPQGFTQGPGNLGFGSQHSVVQPGQFNLPSQMPSTDPPAPSFPLPAGSPSQGSGMTDIVRQFDRGLLQRPDPSTAELLRQWLARGGRH